LTSVYVLDAEPEAETAELLRALSSVGSWQKRLKFLG
jgi:hypothetical protein